MLRRIRELVLIAWFGVALPALYSPVVQADSPSSAPAASATTLPATHLTPTSAVLNALLKTRGQPTRWEFQYGVTTNHYQLTSLSQTPAGLGTISVSARISGLRPRTTYHFRVIAISGFATNYAELYYAADLTFRTKPWHGALLLIGKRLHVSGQVVGARLTCSSKRRCVGRLSIGTRAQGSPVACASKSFRIGAGHRRMVEARVSQACLALLTKAPEHRLQGRFSSATTTGQRGVNTPVKLILG